MNKRSYIITASVLAAAITVCLTGPATAATGQVVDSTGYMVVCPLLSVDPCTAAGDTTNAAADGSGSIGIYGQATGNNATAIGVGAHADSIVDPYTTLYGTPGSTALGNASSAVGIGTTALGSNAAANADYALAIGYGANASDWTSPSGQLITSFGAIAIGYGARGYGDDFLSIGTGAAAQGIHAIAIGFGAYAASSTDPTQGWGAAVAIGDGASASDGSVAVGPGAMTLGIHDVVVGNGSIARGDWQTLVGGSEATADATGGVAIGFGSIVDRAWSVSIGAPGSERQLTNLAEGSEATDAVNVLQLNNGGQAIASWLGGGAYFDATRYFASPMFVLNNPYTAGIYGTVDDALTALDTAISDVSKQPGPVGPAGPAGQTGATGATGATGPAGKDGKDATGGTGIDPLAVHYESATEATVTLRGASGTQIRNVAEGTAGTDAVNVDQLQEALRSANAYTDLRSIDTLNQANAYTDMRIGQLNQRVDYALAAAASNANAAAAVAAQDPAHHNRVAVSDGLSSGVNAWTFMYQHKGESGVTWNASLTGEQGGGSSSGRQVGVGIGYSW